MHFLILGGLVIGLSLGLFGSGGSILTVPVLVYLLGHHDKVAIAESLGIVGGIALLAALPFARVRLIDWRSVLFFGLPGMAGTYLGAWLAKLVPGSVQLTLFGTIMLVAAWMMFRQHKAPDETSQNETGEDHNSKHHAIWKIILEGLAVGVITGLVGVGGGFLIVPALVVLGGLPMRTAVGTSLVIIALKSFSGFFKYLEVLDSVNLVVDWWTVGAFVLLGVLGSIAGNLIGSRVNQQSLKKGFAVFLVVMGLFIIGKEAPAILSDYQNDHPSPESQTASNAQMR